MGSRASPSRTSGDNTFDSGLDSMDQYKSAPESPAALCDKRRVLSLLLVVLFSSAICLPLCAQQDTSGSNSHQLTPRQREIEKQRSRLASSDVEVRRDAVMKLSWMKHPESSRVAATALSDSVPIVRATAASAVLALPADEAVAVLIPLLTDKKEFVRQQVAYALGETRSSRAVDALITAFVGDKKPSVRGAAAVALGMIADETASSPLARALDPGFLMASSTNKNSKQKKEEDQFVQRAAARSLGQMRSRASVQALITAMANKRLSADVRREIVVSLGMIGDVAAVPVLRDALSAQDPYVARNAYEALLKISPSDATVRP